nr:heavy metal-associated isoprenylated plant protein 37-like [Ziziphus jujuba var. spinosa]
MYVNMFACITIEKLLALDSGVYSVNIDAEKHQVTVTGSVDSTTLIKKLAKSGKHAEFWPPSSNQPGAKSNTGQITNQTKALFTDLNASRNQHFLPTIYGTEGNHGWEGSITDELFQQNFMNKAINEENKHLNGNGITIINGDKFEENTISMTGFTGHESGFIGLKHEISDLQDYSAGPHVNDYDYLPPMMKNNIHGYPFNENGNRDMEENSSSYYNMIMNGIENKVYMNQPQMNYASPMIPSNINSLFEY